MTNNRFKISGFTLVEIIIASAVFSLFLGSALGLLFYSQRTISKTTWVNNATRDEGITMRRLSELTKASSYPSTVMSNAIKIPETSATYKVKLPKGSGDISFTGTSMDILAFPVCTEQTETSAGSIKWVSLWLEPALAPSYADLFVHISTSKSYSPGPPDYAAKMTDGAYSTSLQIEKKFKLLHDIEKSSINLVANSSNTVDIVFTLSYPANNNFKKEIKISPTFNVEL